MAFIKNFAAAAFGLAVSYGSALAQEPAQSGWNPVLILTPQEEDAKRGLKYFFDCIDAETANFEELERQAREVFQRNNIRYQVLAVQIASDIVEQTYGPFVKKALDAGILDAEGARMLLTRTLREQTEAIHERISSMEPSFDMTNNVEDFCITQLLTLWPDFDPALVGEWGNLTEEQRDLEVKDPLVYESKIAPQPLR